MHNVIMRMPNDPRTRLEVREPHATIACRGRTSDGYIPDLRVVTVPIVTIIGSSFGRLRARSRKKDPTERHGVRGQAKCKRRLCGRGIGPALLGRVDGFNPESCCRDT
jgi:hypothetical protein